MSKVLPLKWWFVDEGSFVWQRCVDAGLCWRMVLGKKKKKKREGDTEFDQLAATPSHCDAR